MRVKCIKDYYDLDLRKKVAKGTEFEVTEARGKALTTNNNKAGYPLCEEVTAPTTDEEVTAPTADEEVTAPTTDEEVTAPTADEEVTAPTTDEEVTAPTADEEVTAPTTDKVVKQRPKKKEA